MAKGIDLAIAADTRSAMSAINRGVLEPLEDVSEQLEQLGDDSKSATDDLERGMRDAQRRTDDAADEIRKLRDELNKAGRQGKNTGDDIDDGFSRAKQGAEEFKDEANQTAREAAASFDGSAESIGDVFQELAANAFGGFGPAGAVAGIAAAAGIGLAISGFTQIGEASEESKQRAAEWAQAYVDAGGKVLTTAITTAKVMDIATDADKYAKAAENAKNWGVDVSTAINAMAGESWALNAVNDSLATSAEKINDEMREVGLQYDWTGESMTDLSTRTANGQRAFDELTSEMKRGAEQADALSQSLVNTAENTEGASTVVDEFGDKVTTLPGGTTIYIDAETGQATIDLDLIERKVYAMPSDKEITARIKSDVAAAQRDLDGFFVRNGGREIKIKGKIVTDGTWQ
ncbi:hypothetical protein [Microbacterium sp. GCS4]|uniref:hypothetical protein n=1 Tax=Microbacterium sp. GCS4 TaxID=1692239 RepID=UPI000681D2FE|nr:hypothetical protein [Microbacterium sp. GCS4]KNY06867.1 hypothetical protein AKH00_00555 [Microbacterium sp. GCS4]